MYKGTGVSTGVSFAQALIWHAPLPARPLRRKTGNPEGELQRFVKALKSATQKNDDVRQKTARRFGDVEAAIFDAYHMMLHDEEGLLRPVRESIESRLFTAEYAVSSQFNTLAQTFLELDSDYMRQRAEDIYALRDQLLRELLGASCTDASHLDHPSVIVAHSLSPADLASIDLSRLEGIVCETGGFSTHTAIVARTLGIPAVVGMRDIVGEVHNGDVIALDGESGEVWVNPGQQDLDYLRRRSQVFAGRRELAQLYRGLPTITTDGHRVELATNINRLAEVERAIESDAEGIGVFRTEMLHLDRRPMATEEEQTLVYRSLLEKMTGKAVTVRTYDDGGSHNTLPIKGSMLEDNPVLGYRGIRMCLGRGSFFRGQLRALLRASAYGSLKILLPMVSGLEELEEALAIIDEVKLELHSAGVPFDPNVPIGLLIEVPAAALCATQLARRVDFFTIGINDLLQFTLAIDRGNHHLHYLYHLYHPALLQLLHATVTAAHEEGIPCYFSGEVPEYERVLPLLLGLGIDGFSMSPGRVLYARRLLLSTSQADCYLLAQRALRATTGEELRALTAEFEALHGPGEAAVPPAETTPPSEEGAPPKRLELAK